MRTTNNTTVVSAQDMSVSWVTPELSLRHILNYSISIDFTAGASPTGTLYLEISNDTDATVQAANSQAFWQTLNDSSYAITDTTPIMWNVQSAGYRWVRVRYVRTSGTGTVDIKLNVKGQI